MNKNLQKRLSKLEMLKDQEKGIIDKKPETYEERCQWILDNLFKLCESGDLKAMDLFLRIKKRHPELQPIEIQRTIEECTNGQAR